MSERAERATATCPACSPDVGTVHEVLRQGGQSTVRCTECGHVHKAALEEPDTVGLDVVVSQSGESFSARTEAPADETIAVGEEFVLDTEEVLMAVRITGLQLGPEERAAEALVRDVETAWTRAIDNVTVNVTLHPRDGSREETRGVEIGVPGDHEFVVGATEELGDEEFTIERLLVRGDATGYPTDRLDRVGDVAQAKDVKRVYARDESSTAWSAW